jgi:hypothetical protein
MSLNEIARRFLGRSERHRKTIAEGVGSAGALVAGAD